MLTLLFIKNRLRGPICTIKLLSVLHARNVENQIDAFLLKFGYSKYIKAN